MHKKSQSWQAFDAVAKLKSLVRFNFIKAEALHNDFPGPVVLK